MNRKERVLAYIKSPEYVPLKFEELLIVLDVPESDYLEFLKDNRILFGKIYAVYLEKEEK